eukprot:5406907-Alexandrium_andersonii.AAC.1
MSPSHLTRLPATARKPARDTAPGNERDFLAMMTQERERLPGSPMSSLERVSFEMLYSPSKKTKIESSKCGLFSRAATSTPEPSSVEAQAKVVRARASSHCH